MFSGLLMWATLFVGPCVWTCWGFFSTDPSISPSPEERGQVSSHKLVHRHFSAMSAMEQPDILSFGLCDRERTTQRPGTGPEERLEPCFEVGGQAKEGKTDTVRAINSSLFTLKWMLWWLCLSSWITRPFGWWLIWFGTSQSGFLVKCSQKYFSFRTDWGFTYIWMLGTDYGLIQTNDS